jgi:hypothetical protein
MANNRRKYQAQIRIDRKKSGPAKLTNLQKHAKKLQERVAKEGETAWLKDARKRAELRAKKYGIKI